MALHAFETFKIISELHEPHPDLTILAVTDPKCNCYRSNPSLTPFCHSHNSEKSRSITNHNTELSDNIIFLKQPANLSLSTPIALNQDFAMVPSVWPKSNLYPKPLVIVCDPAQ